MDRDWSILSKLFLGFMHLTDEINKSLSRFGDTLFRPISELELPYCPWLAVLQYKQEQQVHYDNLQCTASLLISLSLFTHTLHTVINIIHQWVLLHLYILLHKSKNSHQHKHCVSLLLPFIFNRFISIVFAATAVCVRHELKLINSVSAVTSVFSQTPCWIG